MVEITLYWEDGEDLDRARSLRRFMDKIAVSKAAPAELVGKLELITLMAKWLDALVKAELREGDTVGDRNAHGGLWLMTVVSTLRIQRRASLQHKTLR